MSTQRSDWRASSTSHSSPTCQPWFSPMMRRISGAASLRLFAPASTRVITYCSDSSRSVRWRSATSRSSAARLASIVACLRAELSMSACFRMTKIASTASSIPISQTSGSHAHCETAATPYTDCGHRKQART